VLMERKSMAGSTMGAPMVTKSVSSTIMPVPPMNGGFTPGVDRVIVKNADVSLVVEDTRQAVSEITTLTTQAGGTVTHSSVYENGSPTGQIFANMTLRVPVEKVESTIEALRQVATKVVSENLSAQDRTEQKVDLDAQLSNLRATEAQLQTIMTQAKTVEETLKVQSELSNVRGQIERLQAQLDNLMGDAAMSTISVSLSTEEAELPIVDSSKRSVIQEIKLAARDAVTLYRNLFIAGLRLVILGLPVLVLAGVGYWVTKDKLWPKKKK
jgi:hypothetical protein